MTAPTIDHAPAAQPKPQRAQDGFRAACSTPGCCGRRLPDALRKLDPRTLWRNPVMFIVEIGAVWSTVLAVTDPSWFAWLIVVWLWLTVIFANLAEAVAEGPRQGAGRHRCARPRPTPWPAGSSGGRPAAPAARRRSPRPLLQQGDIVVVEAGQTIPGDGDVVEGIASVDESAITGESAPVIRESGGDRSAVTGGTTVLSDRIVVKITQKPGESFIDRMIALVEGANRQKTPNEIALNILLASLTIIFVFAVATLQPLAIYSKANNPGVPDTLALNGNGITGIVMVALLVCLIPTTIGALLSAIGIAGMDRLVQRNVLAMSGRAVEAAGDVNTLLLDKTGTITLGNRQAADFVPLTGVTPEAARRRGPARPASPTKHPRADPSSCSPSRSSDFAPAPPANSTRRTGSSSARRHGCPASTSATQRLRKGAAGAVAEWVRDPKAASFPPNSATSSTESPPQAAPRWWSARSSRRHRPRRPRCSASSTSRTSSSRACASGSTRCAAWASAR